MKQKWLTPILLYLVVWAGLFVFQSAWVALFGFHLVILVSLLIARPTIPVRILFQNNHIKWILLNLLLCTSSGVAVYFLHPFAGANADLSSQLAALGLTSSAWPAFIAYFSLVNPLLEEFYWRGLLGSDVKTLHPGDFAYAGYHVLILFDKVSPMTTMVSLAALVFIGWFWRQGRREGNGLLAAVLGHMAADFSILLAVRLLTT